MQLRGYQREAIASVYNYFGQYQGNPLLVLPTGAGKSVIHGQFCGEVLTNWTDQRILSLTHVKELIEQNSAAMARMFPQIDIGIYQAGLKRRDTMNRMIFGGIQSVHNKTPQIGSFDLILVDEAHLVPMKDDTMYRRFFEEQMARNDKLKVIGLSATPFRLDSGFLHTGEKALFTDIAYNLPITRLIDEGYLVPLVPKGGSNKMDTAGMKTVRGDFKTSDMVDEAMRVMVEACAEIVEHGADRKAGLIFCPGVEYAKDVADHLRTRYGVIAECLHGETPKEDRARIIAEFRAGQIDYLTNCDILTTGFDAPICDLIAFLRPTQSASLYIQMAGRGMRCVYPDGYPLDTVEQRLEAIAEGKPNTLVLDFAGNVQRHGPVDTINIIDKEGGEKGEVVLAGTAPTKECPSCGAYIAINARICQFCDYIFPPKHDNTATLQPIISTIKPPQPAEWLDVNDILYHRHQKEGKPDSIKVTYRCGLRFVDEWVCPDHQGFAREKAVAWLMARGVGPAEAHAATTDGMLDVAPFFRRPGRIKVKPDGKYERIVEVDFDTQPQTQPRASDQINWEQDDFSDDIPF